MTEPASGAAETVPGTEPAAETTPSPAHAAETDPPPSPDAEAPLPSLPNTEAPLPSSPDAETPLPPSPVAKAPLTPTPAVEPALDPLQSEFESELSEILEAHSSTMHMESTCEEGDDLPPDCGGARETTPAPRHDTMRSDCPWENHKYDRWWFEKTTAAANAIETRLVADHDAVMDMTIVEKTIDNATDFDTFYDHDHMDLMILMWTRMHLEVAGRLLVKGWVHGQMAQRTTISKLLLNDVVLGLRQSNFQSPRLVHMCRHLLWAYRR